MPDRSRTHATLLHPAANDPATNDPLIGTQEQTDSRAEAEHTPQEEVTFHAPPQGQAVKSRKVAAMLGIVLGAFGAHRLYLHYWAVGWFQLGMFLGGFALVTAVATALGSPVGGAALAGLSFVAVVWIWGAVEGLMILTRILEYDGDGHPLAA